MCSQKLLLATTLGRYTVNRPKDNKQGYKDRDFFEPLPLQLPSRAEDSENTEEIRHFSEAKVERSVIALMEFESHLKFKRDVRYQSVRRGEAAKRESRFCTRGIRAQVFEVFYKVSW